MLLEVLKVYLELSTIRLVLRGLLGILGPYRVRGLAQPPLSLLLVRVKPTSKIGSYYVALLALLPYPPLASYS